MGNQFKVTQINSIAQVGLVWELKLTNDCKSEIIHKICIKKCGESYAYVGVWPR